RPRADRRAGEPRRAGGRGGRLRRARADAATGRRARASSGRATMNEMARPGKVILAGGSGLIGRALAAGLARAGIEVVVLSRSSAPRGLPSDVRAVRWDGRSVDGWA